MTDHCDPHCPDDRATLYGGAHFQAVMARQRHERAVLIAAWREPGAGPWVAYRDEPGRRRPVIRHYALSLSSSQAEPVTAQALRFDTRAEALAFARAKWPRRAVGCRIGAERA